MDHLWASLLHNTPDLKKIVRGIFRLEISPDCSWMETRIRPAWATVGLDDLPCRGGEGPVREGFADDMNRSNRYFMSCRSSKGKALTSLAGVTRGKLRLRGILLETRINGSGVEFHASHFKQTPVDTDISHNKSDNKLMIFCLDLSRILVLVPIV